MEEVYSYMALQSDKTSALVVSMIINYVDFIYVQIGGISTVAA